MRLTSLRSLLVSCALLSQAAIAQVQAPATPATAAPAPQVLASAAPQTVAPRERERIRSRLESPVRASGNGFTAP